MDPAWILLKAEGIYNLPAEIIKYLIRQFIMMPRLIQREIRHFAATYSWLVPAHYQAIRGTGTQVYYAPGMMEHFYVDGHPSYGG